MKSIVVLAGGTSDEREVSLRSGVAVTTALETAGFSAQLLDLDADLNKHLKTLQAADAIFPILHGSGGEDGKLQAFLELHQIPYVGSDASASELCFDKWRVKQLLWKHALPTPSGELVEASTIWQSSLVHARFVLKPSNGGSSIDTFIVRDPAVADRPKIEIALKKYDTMLLEQLITGTEITVGVLDNKALPVIEIIPPQSGEFDYENKYNGASQELCPPQSVSDDLQLQAQALAEQVHQLCGCRDMSRTDMMIDTAGKLYILEINTLPGMTNQSLLPKAASIAGISMPELTKKLVTMALDRH